MTSVRLYFPSAPTYYLHLQIVRSYGYKTYKLCSCKEQHYTVPVNVFPKPLLL